MNFNESNGNSKFLIGVLDTPKTLFHLNRNGHQVAMVKSLQRLIEIISGNISNYTIQIVNDIQIGMINGSNYETGLLGMMARKEIDFLLYPLSIDMFNPPGQFTSIVFDEPYIITSYAMSDNRETQNVVRTIETINWETKLSLLGFTILVEVFVILIEMLRKDQRNKCSIHSFILILVQAAERFPSTFFGHFTFSKSLVRAIFVFGLLQFNIFLAAIYSTAAIATSNARLPETLRDIVTLNYKPIFFQGESMYDSFRKGVTSDHRAVYNLAKLKSSEKPLTLSQLDSSFVSPQNVMLSTSRVSKTNRLFARKLEAKKVNLAYVSKPYHNSLQAFLINPNNKTAKFIRNINHLINRQAEYGFLRMLIMNVYDEVILRVETRLKEFDMIVQELEERQKINKWSFKPLTVNGFRKLFILWTFTLVSASILEIILSKKNYQ